MAIIEADAAPQTPFERDVAATQRYFDSPRFDGIIRLYSARQVVEQRGTLPFDYIVAREAAEAFYPRLRELYAQRKSITTFGPYSPGQRVWVPPGSTDPAASFGTVATVPNPNNWRTSDEIVSIYRTG